MFEKLILTTSSEKSVIVLIGSNVSMFHTITFLILKKYNKNNCIILNFYIFILLKKINLKNFLNKDFYLSNEHEAKYLESGEQTTSSTG